MYLINVLLFLENQGVMRQYDITAKVEQWTHFFTTALIRE